MYIKVQHNDILKKMDCFLETMSIWNTVKNKSDKTSLSDKTISDTANKMTYCEQNATVHAHYGYLKMLFWMKTVRQWWQHLIVFI